MKKILETLKRKWAEFLLEIIVIIVGMLGAYTLDNWNESKKEKKFELRFYKELRTDLINNKEEIEGLLWYVEDVLVPFSDSLYNSLDSETINVKFVNQALSSIANSSVRIIFNNSNSTYKYMTNEGFNFIKNDSLRIKITTLYEFGFVQNEKILSWQRDIVVNDLRPSIQHYGLFNAQDKYDVLDWSGLRQNLIFKNHFNNYRNHLRIRKRFCLISLKDLNSLVNEIEQLIFDLSGIEIPSRPILNDSIIKNITGKYFSVNDSVNSSIILEGKRVFLRDYNSPRLEIMQVNDFDFKLLYQEGLDLKLNFVMNDNNEVIELVITYDSIEWLYKKSN